MRLNYFIVLLLLLPVCLKAQHWPKCKDNWKRHALEQVLGRIDTTFLRFHCVKEIIVRETRYKNDTLEFEKLAFKADYKNPKRPNHIEQIEWKEYHGSVYKFDDYGDSVVTIYDEQILVKRPNQPRTTSYNVVHRLNDSLLHSFHSLYLNDSLLYKTDDGIYNIAAATRTMQPVRLLERTEVSSCGSYRHRLPEDPAAVLIKDSLGRVIKATSSAYQYSGDLVPSMVTLVSYVGETNLIESLKDFEQNIPLNPESKQTNYQDLICLSPACLVYEYQASDIKNGIPHTIKITSGKNGRVVEIYKVKIITE